MSYELVAGTVPHRAVEFFKTMPAGTALSTAQLAEAIDADSRSLTISLQTARAHGVLFAKRVTGGRYMVWSLGDGTPPVGEIDDDGDEPLPAKPPAPLPPISARSIFDAALAPDVPRTAQDWMQAAAAGDDVPAPIWPAYREPNPTDAPPPEAVTESAQDTGKDSAEDHADQRSPREQAARFALWSDGALQIEREGTGPVVLSCDDARALFEYLDLVRDGRGVAN